MTPFELLKTACHAACRQTPACAPSYRAMLKTENISQMMAVWREYWEDISGGKYADIINDRLPAAYPTLRKDYADIVTEDELKGYEAILEKVKSEIPPKPKKDEKQN